MNGEIEKERNKTTGLLIINAILWIPILIIILLIIGVARVNAASYKIRIYDLDNTQCVNGDTTYESCNSLSKRALITMSFGQTYSSGTKLYINYKYAYAQRIWYPNRNLWQDTKIYQVYGVDTSDNVHDISNNCNNSLDYRLTRTGTGIQDTELRQNIITGICEITPNYNIKAILIEPYNIYSENPVVSPVTQTSAVSIDDFEVTDQAGMEEQIINNATNNTINIINNATNNTNTIIENANANAEKIEEAINKQYDYCNTYDFNNSIITEEGYLDSNGNIAFSVARYFHTNDYLPINQNKDYTLTTNYNPYATYYCLYDENKTKINCTVMPNNTSTTINSSNAYFIRYTGEINGNKQTLFSGEYCYNYLESIEDEFKWSGANQPNSNTSDNAFEKEEDIFDSLEMDFTLETPQIDTTANNLIWDWVHRLLFTNTIIAGCVIALLTFGVIKLILGR